MSKKQNKAAKTEQVDAGGGIMIDVPATEPVPGNRGGDHPSTVARRLKRAAVAGKIESDLVWSIEDRYSRVKAVRIKDPDGKKTPFAMVYGFDGIDNESGREIWQPVRPVSDRYKPLETGKIIDLAIERINGDLMVERQVLRTDRFGASLEVSIPVNRPIEIPIKPFDANHEWTRFGIKGGDVLYPTVRIRNAYDATSKVIVDVGWFRMICSNGLKIMVAGMGSRGIHTIHEVSRVLDEVAKQDFTGDADIIKRMTKKVLTKKQVADVVKLIPRKHGEKLLEYVGSGGNTAWSLVNGLSFLQTHEYALNRSRQLDKPMAVAQQMAVAA